MKRVLLALFVVSLFAATAQAEMRITEWMYSGANGEFVEFTNVGASAIDMTSWSYSDTDAEPGDVDLSLFGVVQPGESVILTEAVDTVFRTAWGLSASMKVIGGNTDSNLGRNDVINLYDSAGTLADMLAYGDQTYSGTIRTQNVSGNPSTPGVLGANNVYGWVFSSVGDQFGSHASTGGDVGNPGSYAAVPEPASVLLVLTGLAGLLGLRRRS